MQSQSPHLKSLLPQVANGLENAALIHAPVCKISVNLHSDNLQIQYVAAILTTGVNFTDIL